MRYLKWIVPIVFGLLMTHSALAFTNLQQTNNVSGGTNGYVASFTNGVSLTTGVLLDNGTVSGVSATSSTVSFNIQGNGSLNPLNITNNGVSALFVSNSGNVGVNTVSPSAALQVAGTFNVTGAATLSSTLGVTGVSTFTGQIQANNGSAAAPSHSFSFCNGCGMFYTGTGNVIGFATNGLQRLTLDASGNFGINTGTPISTLALTGYAGTNPFVIASSTGTQILTMLQNGNLGLGTTTPQGDLSITGSSGGTNNLLMVASSTNAIALQIAANGGVILGSTINNLATSTGNLSLSHLIGNSTAPSISTSTGVGVGAGTTVSLTGTDLAGFVNFKTTNAPIANAIINTITFNSGYGSSPFCNITSATTSPSFIQNIWATTTTTTLLIESSTTALTATSSYAYYYNCQQ